MTRSRTPGRVAVAVLVVTSWLAGPGPQPSAQPAATPPPTPVPPAGSPSPYPTVLATPEVARRAPALGAASAILVDADSGRVLYELDPGARRPIASTTKIMTALVVLESAGVDEMVTASPRAAAAEGARLGLQAGERIRVGHLLSALMLQSSNDGAVALAEHVAGTVERFVRRMNRRARDLGLRDTRFESPNGLDDRGYSTARDLAMLTRHALDNRRLARIVASKSRTIPAPGGSERHVQNRNALLWLYRGAIGVKTGFTNAAGFCLVAAAERDGLRLISVVLGHPVEAFSDSAALLNHGFARFERRRVVTAGQRFDPLEVEGRTVEVAAGRALEVLVERGSPVAVDVRPRDDLVQPVAVGERAGRVLARQGSSRVGAVPLVVTYVEPPPPPEVRWWIGAATITASFLVELALAAVPTG